MGRSQLVPGVDLLEHTLYIMSLLIVIVEINRKFPQAARHSLGLYSRASASFRGYRGIIVSPFMTGEVAGVDYH